jgi:hypothetical protein
MSIKQFLGGHPSQNGETFLITECIKRIKPKVRVACEFGAPTKEYCSNIYHLIKEGWDCFYFDIDPKEKGIVKAEITPENVNDIIYPCDILSIDTDGNCYAIWKAYTGKPDIVIIEINSSLDPNEDYFTKDEGCNFSMMNKLAKSKGYFLLVHTGNNIYILNKHKELFPDADDSFNASWLK